LKTPHNLLANLDLPLEEQIKDKMLFGSSFIIVLAFILQSQAYLISYYFHENNDPEVDKCITTAISHLTRETCLVFQHDPKANNAIFILESSQCGWQEANSTIHLSSECLTAARCTEFIHQAIARERKHPSMVIRNLNLKFNCTDKCTIDCENGGSETEECTCRCAYGFSGHRCEQVKLRESYTDTSCGIIEGKSRGVISLRGQTEKNTFCQWIIKSTNPWEKFELEFEELDLDNENISPSQRCGDQLYIYGANGILNPIPCDNAGESSLIGEKFQSDSNILFIEYRGNPLTSRAHKGPIFKYRTIASSPPSTNGWIVK